MPEYLPERESYISEYTIEENIFSSPISINPHQTLKEVYSLLKSFLFYGEMLIEKQSYVDF